MRLFMVFDEASLNQTVDRIKASNKSVKPIIIGIEGFGGSGKSTLANKLKDKLITVKLLASMLSLLKRMLNRQSLRKKLLI